MEHGENSYCESEQTRQVEQDVSEEPEQLLDTNCELGHSLHRTQDPASPLPQPCTYSPSAHRALQSSHIVSQVPLHAAT
eukprot:767990-Hanusia_phi.AAC.9